MKLLEQCALLFAICLGSIAISEILPFNFPVSIISMIILFALLCTKFIKEHQIAGIGDYLLKNMAFLFIPAGVGIMEYFELLKGQALVLLFICLITTILTFFASAFTVQGVLHLMNGGKQHE